MCPCPHRQGHYACLQHGYISVCHMPSSAAPACSLGRQFPRIWTWIGSYLRHTVTQLCQTLSSILQRPLVVVDCLRISLIQEPYVSSELKIAVHKQTEKKPYNTHVTESHERDIKTPCKQNLFCIIPLAQFSTCWNQMVQKPSKLYSVCKLLVDALKP